MGCKARSDCALREHPANVINPQADALHRRTAPNNLLFSRLASDMPITVTFRNRSGAYRGVMWIDLNGRPVQHANPDPGETYTINTDMTHPWISTDGRGNCIEMFMPQPGASTFDITAPNRNSGPE